MTRSAMRATATAIALLSTVALFNGCSLTPAPGRSTVLGARTGTVAGHRLSRLGQPDAARGLPA